MEATGACEYCGWEGIPSLKYAPINAEGLTIGGLLTCPMCSYSWTFYHTPPSGLSQEFLDSFYGNATSEETINHE